MPKTFNNLWPQIIDWENLYASYLRATRGRKYQASALRLREGLEECLIDIQNHLIWGTWKPGPYRRFIVHEPKERQVQAPPLRDRIVHHALVRVIEPLFERKFIYDSYACRPGKGIHGASERVQQFLRRAQARWGRVYVLKADISQFFPSVDAAALSGIIARTVRDPKALNLCKQIIWHGGCDGRGVPVGALTSQLFANVYLD
jgi:retron-type reverse transcriptase